MVEMVVMDYLHGGDGEKGARGEKGQKGETGPVGPAGPKCGGVVYTRWEESPAPMTPELNYYMRE